MELAGQCVNKMSRKCDWWSVIQVCGELSVHIIDAAWIVWTPEGSTLFTNQWTNWGPVSYWLRTSNSQHTNFAGMGFWSTLGTWSWETNIPWQLNSPEKKCAIELDRMYAVVNTTLLCLCHQGSHWTNIIQNNNSGSEWVVTALLLALFLAEALCSISPLISNMWQLYCSLLPIMLIFLPSCVEGCQMLSGINPACTLNFSPLLAVLMYCFVSITISLHPLLPRWHPFGSAGTKASPFQVYGQSSGRYQYSCYGLVRAV